MAWGCSEKTYVLRGACAQARRLLSEPPCPSEPHPNPLEPPRRSEPYPNAGSRRDQPRSCGSEADGSYSVGQSTCGQLGIRKTSGKAGSWRRRASEEARQAAAGPRTRADARNQDGPLPRSRPRAVVSEMLLRPSELQTPENLARESCQQQPARLRRPPPNRQQQPARLRIGRRQ